jgi:hypothetical protein
MVKPKLIVGPHTLQLMSDATWAGQDNFPFRQQDADEMERVLNFFDREKQPRKLAAVKHANNPIKRDELLAEIRAAYFLHRSGFNILQWEPPGERTKDGNLKGGEFTASLGSTGAIFVEVKCPGWQGEIEQMIKGMNDQKHEGVGHLKNRRKQPKFIPKLSGGYASGSPLDCMHVVRRNVIPKLKDTCPNLAIIVDNCWASPIWHLSLVEDVQQELLQPCHDPSDPEDNHDYARLSGVLFLTLSPGSSGGIDYDIAFVENPHVLATCALPLEVRALFSKLHLESELRDGKKWICG